MITTRPLTDTFGVEVSGLPLADLRHDHLWPELRALFETHSALLFRGQDVTDETHLRLARLFGEPEDRYPEARKDPAAYEIPKVSNVRDDGSTSAEMDLRTLNLKSNFLWHSDSTFLPNPALTNILIGRVVTSTGGATELASTRAGWTAMPEELRARIRDRGIWHRYSHSRAKISPELARLPMFNKWPDTHWKSVWTNPANGQEALYLASHALKVDGLSEAEGQALIDELVTFCTQPQFVYSHRWQVGDVLLWDQRAVMHRGTPWPFDEPRTLSSICTTATDADGVAAMRLPV